MPTRFSARARDTGFQKVPQDVRPCVQGKFIFIGNQKYFIKGVTYGAFRPNDDGLEFHDCEKIRQDFAMMASNGMNTVRIPHTTPPVHVLDIAFEYDLRVMVGLCAEQYVGYMVDRKKPERALSDIRSKVRSVQGHPALLCYSLGNEIPAPIARWLGRERIERYLRGLFRAVKDEDPAALVTYVNYPSTEYFQLPFLDFYCFNVYLENREKLEAYLARLQNIALDRPLVMSELGLDSHRNGAATQAEVLDWQIRTTFEAGCAGAIVFSWTDEWYRGGGDVDDWKFGLTDRQRRPKPALAAVHSAFAECPFPSLETGPLISAVVCSHNGARTIGECLEHLSQLNYPNYEVIVVDDGSTDETPEIAKRFNVRLIQTENRGLSSARNTGREQARGEIVAYIDDDAYPDPDWLSYYAEAFRRTSHAMIGGPNFPPPSDPPLAQCVARSPGGPTHVLLTDTLAEHVPGCNMAFRKSCLEEVGGFDPIFRAAGDDVDVCWRIQEKGWTIGFAPAAVVWHHRRSSALAYWRQQRGYGKAEALLHQKWPSRFNASNHLPWTGKIYQAGVNLLNGSRSVIYHGVWGEAPFQNLQPGGAALWGHLLEIPELYLLNAALALLAALGLVWSPMLAFLPLLCVGVGYPLLRATLKARQARFIASGRADELRLRATTAVLHLLQPLARLSGRLRYGLTPWKPRGWARAVLPYRRQSALWTESWVEPHQRLCKLERAIGEEGLEVWRGNAYEAWDLEVIGGLLGSARVLMAVEDHGSGRQFVRVATWPLFSKLALTLGFGGILIAGAAALSSQFMVAGVLATGSLLLLGRTLLEAGRSMATVLRFAHKEEPSTSAESAVRTADASTSPGSLAASQQASVERSVLPDHSLGGRHAASKLRIVVTGLIAQHHRLGGVTWDYLQYAVGLARLGHDVYYFEDSGEWPYNTDGGPTGDDWVLSDCTPNVQYLADVMSRFGLEDRWAYHFPIGYSWYGLSDAARKEVVASADLLINVSGTLEYPEHYRQIRRLAYLDSDPGFTQVKLALGLDEFRRRVDAHDIHFSFGECLSDSVPETGHLWRPTRQPILLSEWTTNCQHRNVYTTVMSWTSYRPLLFRRQAYGQKDLELVRFLRLPSRVKSAALEIALSSTHHVNWELVDRAAGFELSSTGRRTPRELLDDAGWRVADPDQVCSDLDSYRAYVQTSKAEWSVAKNGYVIGQAGWFSCRSACYLASGRPAIVQNTGFPAVIPVGEGVFAFGTIEEAAAAIEEVERNYQRHATAALEIAEQYFDSGKVLERLVEEAMAESARPEESKAKSESHAVLASTGGAA